MVIRVSVAVISLTLGLLSLFFNTFQNNTSGYSSSHAYAAVSPENGKTVFEQKCKSCHTIGGGRSVGPDLKGMNTGQDGDWIVRFIVAPDKLIAQNDARAKQLLQEYGFPMPNLGVSEEDARSILAYIESQSGGPPVATPPAQSGTQNISPSKPVASTDKDSAPAAIPPTQSGTQPVLPVQGDSKAGKNLFVGTVLLKNGGPACISCHNISGIGVIGGGTVGKDLTGTYKGMGEAGVLAILKTYPFPMMKEIYSSKPITDDEAGNISAFLKETGVASGPSSANQPIFLIASAAGALLLIGIFQFLWRGRLDGVRRSLVKGGSK